jgi:hypothetical protein
MNITREQAIEIARSCAKAKPQSYYSEPFMPHEWAIDAIMQASAVPEGFAIVPKEMHVDADTVEQIGYSLHSCGDYSGALVWVGAIENDDGTKAHGLHIANAECVEEGSLMLAEFEPWN